MNIGRGGEAATGYIVNAIHTARERLLLITAVHSTSQGYRFVINKLEEWRSFITFIFRKEASIIFNSVTSKTVKVIR